MNNKPYPDRYALAYMYWVRAAYAYIVFLAVEAPHKLVLLEAC